MAMQLYNGLTQGTDKLGKYTRYHRVSGECLLGCINLVSTVCVWAGTRVQRLTIDYFDCGWKELGGGWLDLS